MKWSYRYNVLAVCSIVFAFYHATRQMLSPALPLMKDQFGLSYAQTGFVASAYDIGYGLTLIAGGYLATRVRKVQLIFAGLILLSAFLILTTLSNSFLSISATRILSGASFGAYFAAGIAIISLYFPREERGRALGIHVGVGAGSGKLIAPLVAGVLLPFVGWGPLFYFLAIPALLTAFVFRRTVREPETEATTTTPFSKSLRELLCNRFLNQLGVCHALLTGSAMTVYSFLPLYLTKEMGADLSYGGYAVALLNGVGIPVTSAAGALSDRFGRKATIFVLSVLGALSLYLFPLASGGMQSVVGIVLLGMCITTPFAVILTYAADATSGSHRALALGYINTFSVIGASVGTVLSGYISDVFGMRQVFPFLAAMSALAALLVLLIAQPIAARVAEPRSSA